MSRMIRILIATVAAFAITGPALAGQWRTAAAASSPSVPANAAGGPRGCSAPSDLWVNAVTGDDGNRCLRAEDACLTIQAAIDKIPAVVDTDVVVHIAAGIYGGEIFIGDRLSPKRHGIRLLGEPGVVIDGLGTQVTGLTIENVSGVSIENLEIRGFTADGVNANRVREVKILTSRLVANGAEGLHVEESSGSIIESIVERNGGDGIYCLGGTLVLGDSPAFSPGVPRVPTRTADGEGGDALIPPTRIGGYDRPLGGIVVTSNAGRGIMASACNMQFDGWASISGNAGGLVAAHGGIIDFAGRNDVDVRDNVEFQMMSGCAGMVCRYASSPVSGECLTINYGTCSP